MISPGAVIFILLFFGVGVFIVFKSKSLKKQGKSFTRWVKEKLRKGKEAIGGK